MFESFFYAGLVIKLIYTSLICIFPFVPRPDFVDEMLWNTIQPGFVYSQTSHKMQLNPCNRWPCGGGKEKASVWGMQPSINSTDLSQKRQNIACVCPVLYSKRSLFLHSPNDFSPLEEELLEFVTHTHTECALKQKLDNRNFALDVNSAFSWEEMGTKSFGQKKNVLEEI